MLKNIIIIVVASFIFDFIIGSFLIKRPELLARIQGRTSKTNARHVYKFIFVMIAAVIAVMLKKYAGLNDTITAVIVGFAISLSGVLFRLPVGDVKK